MMSKDITEVIMKNEEFSSTNPVNSSLSESGLKD